MNKGTCLCKAVKISAKTISRDVGVCHCSYCRKWAGGPLLAVEATDKVVFAGKDSITRYESSEWAERGFCNKCGSHLFYHLLPKDSYVIPVGLFENDENFILEHEIFIEEKPSYYNFKEKTQKMTGEQVFAQFNEE